VDELMMTPYSSFQTRISQDYEHFLVMPAGFLYPEITASSLVKVNLQGEVLDPGSTSFGINRNTFGLHAAVHAARPDLKTLVYIKTSPAVAVSASPTSVLGCSHERTLSRFQA
jgi:adducin